MKKILSLIAFLLISFAGFSQTKGISYQAVIIDPNPIQIPGSDITGQPYVSKDVWIRFGIYAGTTLQYEELHKTKTDEFGLVNLIIGAGVNSGKAGTFTSLSWDGVTKNIITSVSFDQGGRYTEVSNQKFNYVPYTLLAETAVKLAGVLPVASAGTGGDAVTPGYYYYNGTIWTRMDPEGWSTPVAITIGATTTAPSKGSTSVDYVRYRNVGGKEYEVEYNLLQTTAGSAGSGDYLISLPGSLQFDFSAPGQVAYTGSVGFNAIVSRLVNVTGDIYNSGAHNSATIIPYDATKFRVHTNNWGTIGWYFWTSATYTMSQANTGFKIIFKFKAL